MTTTIVRIHQLRVVLELWQFNKSLLFHKKKHQLLCFQSFFLLLHRYRECVVYLFKINFPLGGSTVQPTSTIPPNASCSTRCSGAEQPIESNTSNTSSSWTCGCSDDCLLKNSCCSDYAAFCLTGKSHTHTPIYYIIIKDRSCWSCSSSLFLSMILSTLSFAFCVIFRS